MLAGAMQCYHTLVLIDICREFCCSARSCFITFVVKCNMAATRQLAAIMFTDIVGYTALMGSDEQKAFEFLDKNRQLHKPAIESFNGRIIKELGDGVLAIFNTATDAVNAAIKIKEACNRENNFSLRIGIHLGDIVIENGDVFGDGVNVASRIQAAAKPGSIYLSEAVQQNISNKKNITTKFAAEQQLKNVKDPVRMYEVIDAEKIIAPLFPVNVEVTSQQKKSIAVLPFVNMSNDPEQDYFCDGISEEILNALTHLSNLRVVSRTSSFALKEKNLDVREIGKILGVESLLEGSVRKSGHRLRITTKLVNVSDGSHLWSEKYDRECEDIFSIQEDIAANVATALKGFLTSEEKIVMQRPETIIQAYEYFLKGRELFHRLFLYEAKELFQKAIAVDSEYALAYAGLADVHSWLYDWLGTHTSDLEAAEANSLKALSLAPGLSESHISRAFVLSLARRYDESDHEFGEAIRLNSNSYDAYYLYARSFFARGNIEQAAVMFHKASDIRSDDYQSTLLLAMCLKKLGSRDEKEMLREGIRRARKQFGLNPVDRRLLSLGSTSLYDYGDKEEAFKWINKALELYPEDVSVLINGLCLFAKANNKEKAFSLLEQAISKGYGKRDWIAHDPDYDLVRSDPRFKALLDRMQ